MAIVGHIKLFLTILFIYLFFILELDWLDLHSFTSCGVHWPVHSLTLTFFVPHVDLEKHEVSVNDDENIFRVNYVFKSPCFGTAEQMVCKLPSGLLGKYGKALLTA